jgi:TPP-dependent pyruvate/acetoin dehydrogenase alpha subunit
MTHVGLNFAAVQKVPAILIIQNNQVALGTRLDQHHAAGSFADWPAGYGVRGGVFDGNNVLDAYAATKLAAAWCRAGEGPALLVGETFRMGGHATHDEREARDTFPDALFAAWGRRDPIGRYETYLVDEGVTREQLAAIEDRVTAEVDAAAREALLSRDRMPVAGSALDGVYGSA